MSNQPPSLDSATSHTRVPGTGWWAIPCLVVIVILGAYLRFRQAGESLWLDELHTSWVVSGAWTDVAPRAQAGNQSPLYFYLVWGVVQVAGQSTWTLRFVSLLAGTLLIAGVAWLVRHWSDSVVAALVAALLLAWQRDCIFYAQEARPYALVQLSALLHSAVFVGLLQRPTVRLRLLYVCGAAWLFYLHYTTFLLLVAQAGCLAALRARSHRRVAYTRSQAIVDAAWIAALLLPAATHVVSIAHRRENWRRFVEAWPPPVALQVAVVLFGLLPWAAAAGARWMQWKRGRLTMRDLPVAWGAAWFLLPIVLAWLATLFHIAPLCMVRYLVASLVGAIVFAALCLALFHDRRYTFTLAAALGVSTILSSGMIEQYRLDGRLIGDRNEQWDRATHWLNRRLLAEPHPVFLCAGLLEDTELAHRGDRELVHYCLFPLSGIYPVDTEHLVPLPTTTSLTLTPDQHQLVEQSRGAWLVVRAGPRTTARVTRAVTDILTYRTSTYVVLEQRRFGNVAVVHIGVAR